MYWSEAIRTGDVFALAPLVVFLPLLGMLFNILLGRRVGEKLVGTVASAAAGLAFGVAVLLAVALTGRPEGMVLSLADWIAVGGLQVTWALRVDALSVTMMLVVAGVGALIHIYSIGYMHADVRHNGDPGRYSSFFVYMNLFIAAMMVLVSGDSYLVMFVGWEGVGLCSYLLIGFWYDKEGNATAAKKAFVVNRIGDFGFLMALLLMFWKFGALDFDGVFSQAALVAQNEPGVILAITLLLLLGVAGKSAQLPLFVWLPDAMAGPTPVSALIHAATMVTAGVYLVARSHALYTLSPTAQMWVALVGGVTALFAATIAVAQFDIKKVLAYSTISQLGFMVAAVGMGAFTAGLFHLVTHAFFKALLFLSAGSVIQGMERGQHHEHDALDPQDMRNMGGLAGRMKLTFGVYLVGALALAGIPPLAGFWSKDEILAEALHLNFPVYALLTLAAFGTAFYMARQVWLVFFGQPRSSAASHAVESPAVMTLPLVVLALLSLLGGALNLPGMEMLAHWFEPVWEIHKGGFNPAVAGISTGLALLGVAIAWLVYRRPAPKVDDPLRPALGLAFRGMEQKWKVDELYDWLIVRRYTALARFLAGRVDLGFIDGIANGLAAMIKDLSAALRRLQTGYVHTYVLSILLGVVLILGYLILR